MKTLLPTLLLSLAFSFSQAFGQSNSQFLASTQQPVSKLKLQTKFVAEITYKSVMKIDRVTMERLPVNTDPDERTTSYFCQTNITSQIGEISFAANVEKKSNVQSKLPLYATVSVESGDDGECRKPQLDINTKYDVSISTGYRPISFKGKKNLREFSLALSLSSVHGKAILAISADGELVIRGFDFNQGKVVRSINDLEVNWAAYYKTSSDPRIILQEQGKVLLSDSVTQ